MVAMASFFLWPEFVSVSARFLVMMESDHGVKSSLVGLDKSQLDLFWSTSVPLGRRNL